MKLLMSEVQKCKTQINIKRQHEMAMKKFEEHKF